MGVHGARLEPTTLPGVAHDRQPTSPIAPGSAPADPRRASASSSITRSVISWNGAASSPDHASSIGRPTVVQIGRPHLNDPRPVFCQTAREPQLAIGMMGTPVEARVGRHRSSRTSGARPLCASSLCPPPGTTRTTSPRARVVRRGVERRRVARAARHGIARAPEHRHSSGIRTAPSSRNRGRRPRRSIASPFVSGSRYEMWLHTTIAGPVDGIRWRCSFRRRNHSNRGGRTTAFATWYHGSVACPLGSEVEGYREGSARPTRRCVVALPVKSPAREVGMSSFLSPLERGLSRWRCSRTSSTWRRGRRMGDLGRHDRRERPRDRVAAHGRSRGGRLAARRDPAGRGEAGARADRRARDPARRYAARRSPRSERRCTLGPVVIAPSTDERGTNLLLRRPPSAIPSRFGSRFVPPPPRGGGGTGVPTAVVEREELSFDVHDPGDILTVLESRRAGRTLDVCRDMDLAGRLART